VNMTPFPFELPFPTAFYLTLYVLTFALHQAFMHYVLAGSLYVAWTICFPGPTKHTTATDGDVVPRNDQPLAAVLRDWMPFLLSAAITAGVAPLLFIQIVYQRQFYSANLLLFWRWMVVVPVLIVAFYLLYLIKSSIMKSWPHWLRTAIAVLTAGCFIFVGFCWTANHLLGMSELQWPEIYLTGKMPFLATTIFVRMLIWIGGSFATMATAAGWQLYYSQSRNEGPQVTREIPRLAKMAMGGLVVASLAGFESLHHPTLAMRDLVFERGNHLYLLLLLLGLLMQIRCWWKQLYLKRLQVNLLSEATLGATFSLLGISFLREAIRVRIVNSTFQYHKHAEAAQMDGFWVFVIFTVIVTAVIVWCIQIVREGLRATESNERDKIVPKA
jgi:hypothetical protein